MCSQLGCSLHDLGGSIDLHRVRAVGGPQDRNGNLLVVPGEGQLLLGEGIHHWANRKGGKGGDAAAMEKKISGSKLGYIAMVYAISKPFSTFCDG